MESADERLDSEMIQTNESPNFAKPEGLKPPDLHQETRMCIFCKAVLEAHIPMQDKVTGKKGIHKLCHPTRGRFHKLFWAIRQSFAPCAELLHQ